MIPYVKSRNHLLQLLVDFLEHSMRLEALQSVTSAGDHSLNPGRGESMRMRKARMKGQNKLMIQSDIYFGSQGWSLLLFTPVSFNSHMWTPSSHQQRGEWQQPEPPSLSQNRLKFIWTVASTSDTVSSSFTPKQLHPGCHHPREPWKEAATAQQVSEHRQPMDRCYGG